MEWRDGRIVDQAWERLREKKKTKLSSRSEVIERLLHSLWDGATRAVASASEIDVVGHRVVHGGPDFEDPVFITAEAKSAIAGDSAFPPLHNRAGLEGTDILRKLLGGVPQVAVFATGFHKHMPLSA